MEVGNKGSMGLVIEGARSLEMVQDVEMPVSTSPLNYPRISLTFTGQGDRVGRGMDLHDQPGRIHFPRQRKGRSPERHFKELADQWVAFVRLYTLPALTPGPNDKVVSENLRPD